MFINPGTAPQDALVYCATAYLSAVGQEDSPWKSRCVDMNRFRRGRPRCFPSFLPLLLSGTNATNSSRLSCFRPVSWCGAASTQLVLGQSATGLEGPGDRAKSHLFLRRIGCGEPLWEVPMAWTFSTVFFLVASLNHDGNEDSFSGLKMFGLAFYTYANSFFLHVAFECFRMLLMYMILQPRDRWAHSFSFFVSSIWDTVYFLIVYHAAKQMQGLRAGILEFCPFLQHDGSIH